jgi:hypothetical protein
MKSSNPIGFEDFFLVPKIRLAATAREKRQEVLMVLVKVQYDAYNRQFKLIDGGFQRVLEDGETYMLIADVSIKDLRIAGGQEIASDTEPIIAS